MINRREFIGCVAASIIIPYDENKLRFTRTPSCGLVQIKKGPHSFKCSSDLQTLQDWHNICATDEITIIAVQELEYGKEGLRKLWFFDGNEEDRKKLLISLKKFSLSRKEKIQIHKLMKKLRGKHDCVCGPWWFRDYVLSSN